MGDVTSSALFGSRRPALIRGREQASFVLLSKDDGVLCGLEVFARTFSLLDRNASFETEHADGDRIGRGLVIGRLRAELRAALAGERTALNLISHLSGIASRTRLFVDAAAGRPVILDTRKTLPGLRALQKYAVACGGGENHRLGLYDMVLIKDNHVDAAGGVERAVALARGRWGRRFKIEVETRTLDEVKAALASGVDRIMLDNMDDDGIRAAVGLVAGRAQTEASGNMSLERMPALHEAGVDFVSVGELTHSVRAHDFSLKREATS